MSELARDLSGIVVGWILGLATTLASDWVRGRRRVAAVRRSVIQELNEVAYRLTFVVFNLESRRGRLDRDLVHWLRTAIMRYQGPNQQEALPEGLSSLLEVSDEEFVTVSQLLASPTKTTFIQPEEASYSVAALTQAHEYDRAFATQVLDVLSSLRMYNETRQNVLQYQLMTFDSGLSEGNHSRVIENENSAIDALSRRARQIVDKVMMIEEQFEARSINHMPNKGIEQNARR
ncbi:MAG: hypothetical protein HGA39_09660 [Coriobacteriia bacterium]|nr:hypothetical protein [Coriobacteriia bacterium]